MDLRAGLLLATSFLMVANATMNVDGEEHRRQKGLNTHFGLQPRSPWPFRSPADEVAEAREIAHSAGRMKDTVAHRLRLYQGIQGPSDIVLSGERPGDGSKLTYADRMTKEEEAWIVAAGKLRADNCVNLMLNRISDGGNALMRSRAIDYPEGRPAFFWLREIGSPAFIPALHRIPQESDGLTRVYLVGLLQAIKGNAETRAVIVELEKNCADEEQRTRVAEAIQQCDDAPEARALYAYYQAKSGKVDAPDDIDVASAKIRRQAAVDVLLKADPAALVEPDENGEFSEIMLTGEAITDEVFSQVKNFPEVNTVLVMNSKVTDAGLRHLRDMKNITTLMIIGSEITDAGFDSIKDLTNLRVLSLSENRITGEGLANLKELSSLEELNLCATEVADEKLAHLSGLPKLRKLTLDGYWITEDAAKAVRKSFPRADVSLNRDFRLKLIKITKERHDQRQK
ncbi:MAG TPA: hypothetical protein PLR25_12340 [Planctomycetaceae bacterium]|nr:hypothetical protein [Planctomycetaceae bacterium]